jgi:hypothetical protein
VHSAYGGGCVPFFSARYSEAHASSASALIVLARRLRPCRRLEGLDITPFKPKISSAHWEPMFTRPVLRTVDMQAQHELLTKLAGLVDQARTARIGRSRTAESATRLGKARSGEVAASVSGSAGSLTVTASA